MIDDMTLRKLAPKTPAGHIRAVRKLTRFLGRAPDTATVEDLRRYELHLVANGISNITLNATISGLHFLFEVTLDRRDALAKMIPVRAPRTLPVPRSDRCPRRYFQGNRHQISIAKGRQVSDPV